MKVTLRDVFTMAYLYINMRMQKAIDEKIESEAEVWDTWLWGMREFEKNFKQD